MTDSTAGPQPGDNEPTGAAGDEQAETRHRVIGTPPPAEARSLLKTPSPGAPGGPPVPRQRELPADSDNPVSAKRAERVVVACFLIATLAGLGFIAAYVIFQVHSVTNVQHSNLALGLTMGLTFLALAVGAVIWVRRLMPTVEITEARKPLRSSPEDRAAFAETFAEGAEASQFVKRPMVRRTLIAATVPVALAPIVLLRDLGPLPARAWITRSGATACACSTTAPTRRSGPLTSARPAG